jgi:hypothetical protein
MDPSPFATAKPTGVAKRSHGSGNGIGNGNGKANIAGAGGAGFDAFMDMNPFTLKTLDAYRMQLWGRMAVQNQQYQHQQQQQHQHQQQLTGLAKDLQPRFFRDAQGLSGLLSGKASASGATTPPSSPSMTAKDWRDKEREREVQQRDAMYAAAIASQTLLGKLGSAFWDAFSGSQAVASSASNSPHIGTSSGGPSKQWDADKVRRVLEGKAVVRVVDVESPSSSPKIPAQVSTKIPSSSPSVSTSSSETRSRCVVTVSDILEESMRSLSLGKK